LAIGDQLAQLVAELAYYRHDFLKLQSSRATKTEMTQLKKRLLQVKKQLLIINTNYL